MPGARIRYPCADFDFWQSISPLNAAKTPADGVLVLQAAHVGGVDADWLTKIELTVTKDGQPIAGALAATSAHGLLIWRPDAPWTPGAYQMSGLVTNPDFGGTYCGEATLPFAADLLIDTEIAATLEPVEFSANVMTQIDPFVTLGTLACCPGATPSEQYGGCGANTVLWDETTCAPTRTNGYLNVTLTGMPAAAGPAADQILYTLKIDGDVHSSSLIPSFAGIYATTAICAVIEAQDLASGKVTVSEEQCFGEDMADVLGVHPQDPSKTLACALQQCEIVNEMWDPMNCTPYDPENVPTTSDRMSSSGSDSGVSEDRDKGCACHTTPPNNAGLLALVAMRRPDAAKAWPQVSHTFARAAALLLAALPSPAAAVGSQRRPPAAPVTPASGPTCAPSARSCAAPTRPVIRGTARVTASSATSAIRSPAASPTARSARTPRRASATTSAPSRSPMARPGRRSRSARRSARTPVGSANTWRRSGQVAYLAIVATLVLVAYLLVERQVKSPWGRMMRAIRDNELAAAAMGKQVEARRLQAFIFGSALMGLAGALFVHFNRSITPEAIDPMIATFLIWIMLILGGSGNNRGAILGAAVIWIIWSVSELLTDRLPTEVAVQAKYARVFIIGLTLQLVLRFRPEGILPERQAGSPPHR